MGGSIKVFGYKWEVGGSSLAGDVSWELYLCCLKVQWREILESEGVSASGHWGEVQ